MQDLDEEISRLYAKQPSGSFKSEKEYRDKIIELSELLVRRERGQSLFDRLAYETMIISFQADHGLTIREIEQRLTSAPEARPPILSI